MDINEVNGQLANRHPWELSRTKSVIGDVLPYLRKCENKKDYINIGAGDMYFDRCLMKKLRGYTLHAVDLGYADIDPNSFDIDKESVKTYVNIDELPDDLVTDSAFMMDSLEYIEDEPAFIKQLSQHVRSGGYVFITVPAFRKLFSEHDVIVKLLHRYDKRDIRDIVDKVPEVKLVGMHYFYTPLLLVRFLQKTLNMKIDPEHKVTTGWEYGENHPITFIVKGILNIDYAINKALGRIHLDIPGLSIIAILRKE